HSLGLGAARPHRGEGDHDEGGDGDDQDQESHAVSWTEWSFRLGGGLRGDVVLFELVEHALVDVPPVEDGVGVPAEVGGGGGRHPVEQVPVGFSADDDAGVTVAGEQHAQPPGGEVEGVGLGLAGQGCQAMTTSYWRPWSLLAVLTTTSCQPAASRVARSRSFWSLWDTPTATRRGSRATGVDRSSHSVVGLRPKSRSMRSTMSRAVSGSAETRALPGSVRWAHPRAAAWSTAAVRRPCAGSRRSWRTSGRTAASKWWSAR